MWNVHANLIESSQDVNNSLYSLSLLSSTSISVSILSTFLFVSPPPFALSLSLSACRAEQGLGLFWTGIGVKYCARRPLILPKRSLTILSRSPTKHQPWARWTLLTWTVPIVANDIRTGSVSLSPTVLPLPLTQLALITSPSSKPSTPSLQVVSLQIPLFACLLHEVLSLLILLDGGIVCSSLFSDMSSQFNLPATKEERRKILLFFD